MYHGSAVEHDLECVVTNVVAFGGFVDIGVHQDGLVQVSAMANQLSETRT
jgi:transcriptional accessory protein Tex/SPT6